MDPYWIIIIYQWMMWFSTRFYKFVTNICDLTFWMSVAYGIVELLSLLMISLPLIMTGLLLKIFHTLTKGMTEDVKPDVVDLMEHRLLFVETQLNLAHLEKKKLENRKRSLNDEKQDLLKLMRKENPTLSGIYHPIDYLQRIREATRTHTVISAPSFLDLPFSGLRSVMAHLSDVQSRFSWIYGSPVNASETQADSEGTDPTIEQPESRDAGPSREPLNYYRDLLHCVCQQCMQENDPSLGLPISSDLSSVATSLDLPSREQLDYYRDLLHCNCQQCLQQNDPSLGVEYKSPAAIESDDVESKREGREVEDHEEIVENDDDVSICSDVEIAHENSFCLEIMEVRMTFLQRTVQRFSDTIFECLRGNKRRH